MRSFSIIGCYQRLAYLVICNIFFFSSYGYCLNSEHDTTVHEILNFMTSQELSGLQNKLDSLNEKFESSKISILQGKAFIELFLKEINAKSGLNFTLQEACELIKEKLNNISISKEMEFILLETINLFEIKETYQVFNQINSVYINFLEYFLPGPAPKKHKIKESNQNLQQSEHPFSLIAQTPYERMEKELPGNCYVGGCELLAGALVFLLPLPGASWLGCVMMGDGARRVIDGMVQLGDERRANPNYTTPPNPPGFNF